MTAHHVAGSLVHVGPRFNTRILLVGVLLLAIREQPEGEDPPGVLVVVGGIYRVQRRKQFVHRRTGDARVGLDLDVRALEHVAH